MTDHTAIQETDEMRQQWAKHIEQGAPKREWVGLTGEEFSKCLVEGDPCEALAEPEAWEVMRSVEAKLKEKNGAL